MRDVLFTILVFVVQYLIFLKGGLLFRKKGGCYSESVVVCINPHCTHRIMIEVTRRGKVQC